MTLYIYYEECVEEHMQPRMVRPPVCTSLTIIIYELVSAKLLIFSGYSPCRLFDIIPKL